MTTAPDAPDPLDGSDPSDPSKRTRQLSLVVVGASAGGVEALSTLVSTLPGGFPAPVVLAQHLDPTHLSHLGEILARLSRLPVQTVIDQAPLEPGTIYVVPADRNVEVTDHALRLRPDGEGKRPMPSINLLFTSAARAFGEQLIAVILTGTGSDGASGAYQVKAAGGIVIIENPETAAYPALPASLAPTTVDFVVDLERIGPLLSELLTQPDLPAGLRSGTEEPGRQGASPLPPLEPSEHEQTLLALLEHVRERTNIDFNQYKLPTILRRLQRRMFATQTADLSAYMHYLERHPEEYHRLVGSFLIKVTEFFRDPEVFAILKDRVLPDLVAEARNRGNVLRMWSAGCATGEEAYSLAILISEVLGEELDQFAVQIFATDVDEDAIEFGRHGVYPPAALDGVSTQRRARYFQQLDGNYRVAKALRALVIFGVHDLGLRAPFPHIDLVLCRNVLMYFTKDLQSRALQSFAFSLRNGGYLVLGSAETASPLPESFTPVSLNLRLYQRYGERVIGPIPTNETLQELGMLGMARPRSRLPAYVSTHERAAGRRPSQQNVLASEVRNSRERLGALVLGLPMGIVVIDRHYDIQIINGMAMRLLDIFTEPMGEDLLHLAQSIPTDALRTVIDAAFRGGAGATRQPEVAPQATAPPEPGSDVDNSVDHLEQVVTVETLLGEQRSLEFSCYPYMPSPPVQEGEHATGTPGEHEAQATEQAAVQSDASARRQAVDVPLVLILIRDVTDAVGRSEHASHAAAERQAESQAMQARKVSDLEAKIEQLHSENERLKTEIARQSNINRALLEGNQQLAETNLNLRSTNEDLQLGAEEAEASTEEVKTLNEELQATNEELVTLNEELEATVEELHAANDELQARTREWAQTSVKPEVPSRGPSE